MHLKPPPVCTQRVCSYSISSGVLCGLLLSCQRPENASKVIVALLPDTGDHCRYPTHWFLSKFSYSNPEFSPKIHSISEM